MKLYGIIVLLALGILAAGCAGRQASAERIDDLAKIIADKAASNDTHFFEHYLDKPYKGWGEELVKQINRSGIIYNYSDHLRQKSESEARLDYHFFEKQCNFQIDLQKKDGYWSVKKIWFCR